MWLRAPTAYVHFEAFLISFFLGMLTYRGRYCHLLAVCGSDAFPPRGMKRFILGKSLNMGHSVGKEGREERGTARREGRERKQRLHVESEQVQISADQSN